jgi:hypothetical protein
MEWDWSEYRKPQVLIGMAATFIAGAALIWNIIAYRVPELERHDLKQDQVIEGNNTATNANIDKQFTTLAGNLSAMEGRLHDQYSRMDLAIKGLKVNMARICNQRRISNPSTCSPDSLVADVKSQTQAVAQFFDSAKLTLDHGPTPVVETPGLKEQLPTYTFDNNWTFPAVASQKADKAEMAQAILWSSAAKDAHWHQAGNSLVVVFANGTASFDLSAPTSKEHVGELVQSLNTNTQALKESPPAGKKPE